MRRTAAGTGDVVSNGALSVQAATGEVAWEGRPMPASTMTGTSTSSTMILMKSRAASPLFDPMGAASGMTAAAPARTRSRAQTRSGNM